MRIIAFAGVVLLAFLVLTAPSSSAQVAVGISVGFAPPPLPVYEQPLCPSEGYIWVPGYWAWDDDFDDYYWVPGTWVLAPEVGFLWTPPWWGWADGVWLFHAGYWGPLVGFYGGISYGFGYFGEGYVGGRWEGDRFFYNRSVTNVNVVNIRNVYNETVINNNVTVNHVSYNGGPGGVQARPQPQDERAAHERHIPPPPAQQQQWQAARSNPELRASANRGRPPIAATARPAEFRGGSAVPAREAGGPYTPPANRGNPRAQGGGSRPAIHPNDLPPLQRPGPPNTGNPNLDRKYQQQQEKMYARQEQERQRLQQKQDQEHQRVDRRNAPPPERQQMEQRHQQQTEQMHQRHEQQQQRIEEKQRPRGQ